MLTLHKYMEKDEVNVYTDRLKTIINIDLSKNKTHYFKSKFIYYVKVIYKHPDMVDSLLKCMDTHDKVSFEYTKHIHLKPEYYIFFNEINHINLSSYL